jgi:hypothetical protein
MLGHHVLLYDVRPPQKIWENNSEMFSQKMNFCISDIRKILNDNVETNGEERKDSFLSSSTDHLDIERNEESEETNETEAETETNETEAETETNETETETERNETEAETETNETERKQKGKHSIKNLNSEGGKKRVIQ